MLPRRTRRARRGRGRPRRRRRPVPAGHRASRAPPPRLPDRLRGHVRVERRHVDAERHPRRVRARADRQAAAASAWCSSRSSGRCCSSRSRAALLADTRRPAAAARHAADRAGRRCRSCSPRSSWTTRLRRRGSSSCIVFAIGIANALGAPGLERDPADARAARRHARRGRADVRADEPVACHRSRDRRR